MTENKTHYEYEVSVITEAHVGREGNTLTRVLAGEENCPLNNNKHLCNVVSQHYAPFRAI